MIRRITYAYAGAFTGAASLMGVQGFISDGHLGVLLFLAATSIGALVGMVAYDRSRVKPVWRVALRTIVGAGLLAVVVIGLADTDWFLGVCLAPMIAGVASHAILRPVINRAAGSDQND